MYTFYIFAIYPILLTGDLLTDSHTQILDMLSHPKMNLLLAEIKMRYESDYEIISESN